MTNTDKLIKELKSKPASEIISGIYKYQDEHNRWFLNSRGGFVSYFEPSYDFYVSLVSSLNYVDKKGWGWSKNLPFIYLGNSTYPLFKAYTLSLEGFYDESLILSREALELLIKSIFCICYRKDCFATYSKPEKGKRAFNLTNFLDDDLKIKSDFLYRLPSAGSHGQLYITRILHALKQGKKHDKIGLTLKLDTQMVSASINYLTFLIWAHIYLLTVVFNELAPGKEINNKVRKDAQFYIKTLGHIVKSTPKGFSKIGEDFEKIIKIVEVAIEGKDWKKFT
ncbi:hypothetical protein A2Z67_05305 [Candidatus Woesebacteria bacterium RBG_13_36_22]|uniref:Uncharacterized protein n=1 Tax=Candidatus Woesebacteria bacterium RBG_13_36_22 TaxID=1802478 RepID=A0A1F7X6B9_9BACT|nr:MAG: hypothetical protein A2Z67_05305 [Candidatus Woesebacteria bacterium RBG_13_36_22]